MTDKLQTFIVNLLPVNESIHLLFDDELFLQFILDGMNINELNVMVTDDLHRWNIIKESAKCFSSSLSV